MELAYKKILVIINPASGGDEPILNTLNDVFHPVGVEWDIRITHKFGDATNLAKEAAAKGVDLVAGYGGDGTQMEIANGLLGSGIPMAILPGGTGNAMAHELNVPINLKRAAEMIISSSNRRAVDLARIGDRVFMLRAYSGVSAQDAASREKKNQYGQLAYIQASLKILTHISPTHFRAMVDGEVNEGEALICFILNAGSIGGVLGHNLPSIGNVSISDGYLDLFVLTRGIQPLIALSSHLSHIGESHTGIYHWRAKEITLEVEPPQDVWIDGEIFGQTPITTIAIPRAIEIVVPA